MPKLQEIEPTDTVMVQGEGKVDPEIYELYEEFGNQLKEKNWKVIAGAYGDFVAAVSKSGTEYRPHDMGRGKEIQGAVPPEDCLKEVQQINPEYGIVHAWGMRLGHMIAEGGAYAFFAGKEGTMAHAIPTIALMSKGFTNDGTSRTVALIGWQEKQVQALKDLGLVKDGDFGNWIDNFEMNKDGIKKAVDFMTSPRMTFKGILKGETPK